MLRRTMASLSGSSLRGIFRNPNPNVSQRFFSAASEDLGSEIKKKGSSFRRKAVPVVLLSLTGGIALSALNDLAIFHGCTRKAIEKASQNQKIVESLGEPIVRGPWYDATLAVGHRRNSVSCTFPVAGPQGSGVFQLKAVRTGEDSWFSFLRHHDWDILIMDALLHVPSNDEKQQTVRVSLSEIAPPPSSLADCKSCSPLEPGASGK
ncbi:uncharacterized protein M6B38_297975 [Iris pallida]|uniref:Mitochondrial import inner membrane translocase subunit Tim21 n=1 Tax=Iris pallida TaxID=29817 RepID=A0AAX6HNM5_IRIPA|nr:uncharacterized protein M6B38_297975 [Iris pallida]